MNIKNNSADIWIGLVGVKPTKKGILPDKSEGAYVNCLAFVFSDDSFCETVQKSLSESGFEVVEIEDVELFVERVNKEEVEKPLVEMAKECKQLGDVCCGTFFVWDK